MIIKKGRSGIVENIWVNASMIYLLSYYGLAILWSWKNNLEVYYDINLCWYTRKCSEWHIWSFLL